ncbi:MAG: hypothetical protein V4760_14410 [Bdellovibrionota bacterium]
MKKRSSRSKRRKSPASKPVSKPVRPSLDTVLGVSGGLFLEDVYYGSDKSLKYDHSNPFHNLTAT